MIRPDSKDERKARLAAALRANLRRRKDQRRSGQALEPEAGELEAEPSDCKGDVGGQNQ